MQFGSFVCICVFPNGGKKIENQAMTAGTLNILRKF
jgi:hypothetical protein